MPNNQITEEEIQAIIMSGQLLVDKGSLNNTPEAIAVNNEAIKKIIQNQILIDSDTTIIPSVMVSKQQSTVVKPAKEQISDFFQINDFFVTKNQINSNVSVFFAQKEIYKKPKQNKKSGYVNTVGINTKAFDGYRQGVEITETAHLFLGMMAKIHAGEKGHVIKKCNFGSDDGNKYDAPDYFIDKSKFHAKTYLELQQEILLEIKESNYHIIDNDITYDVAYDGAIEPLTIRAKATFNSINFPFESHDVFGDIMSGNERSNKSSDQVCSIYEFQGNSKFIPFLDLNDINQFGMQSTGYFITDEIKLSPYNDITFIDIMGGDDIKSVIMSTSPSTENYISRKQKTSPVGWDYDNNIEIGTDSIAFGGMTYLCLAQNHQEIHLKIISKITF